MFHHSWVITVNVTSGDGEYWTFPTLYEESSSPLFLTKAVILV